MSDLLPFNPEATCAKCGGDDVGVAYHAPHPPSLGWPGAACPAQEDANIGHHYRRCRRCNFTWLEAPLKAEPRHPDEPQQESGQGLSERARQIVDGWIHSHDSLRTTEQLSLEIKRAMGRLIEECAQIIANTGYLENFGGHFDHDGLREIADNVRKLKKQ